MATVSEIRRACETFYDTQIPVIQRVQAKYKASTGRYWQGLLTPSEKPDDGATRDPDLKRRPSDQAESWEDVFKDLDVLPVVRGWPASCEISVYEGPHRTREYPDGWGFTVSLIFTKDDAVSVRKRQHIRTWNFGPEPWREHAWREDDIVTDPEPPGRVPARSLEGVASPSPPSPRWYRRAWDWLVAKAKAVWEWLR